jgi:hypothetical protein
MGRLRIKKKEKVIPFRETMAYRLLLILSSGIVFIVMFVQATAALRAGNRAALIISSIFGVLAAIALFYNGGQARYARVSEHASKRMRRR